MFLGKAKCHKHKTNQTSPNLDPRTLCFIDPVLLFIMVQSDLNCLSYNLGLVVSNVSLWFGFLPMYVSPYFLILSLEKDRFVGYWDETRVLGHDASNGFHKSAIDYFWLLGFVSVWFIFVVVATWRELFAFVIFTCSLCCIKIYYKLI